MWKSKTPGIPDEEFERTESVPITKEEVSENPTIGGLDPKALK